MWGNLQDSSSDGEEDSDTDNENDIDKKNNVGNSDDEQGASVAEAVTGTAARQGDGNGTGEASETGGRGLAASPRGVFAASPPPPAEIDALGGGDRQPWAGWSCEKCTFWNVIGEGGDAEHPRCGVCEADGPRNAGSPWVSA